MPLLHQNHQHICALAAALYDRPGAASRVHAACRAARKRVHRFAMATYWLWTGSTDYFQHDSISGQTK